MRYIPKRHFMTRYRKPPGKGRRFRRVILCGAVLFAVWAGLAEAGLSSVSQELTLEAARGYVLASVNRAIEEELAEQETDLVTVERTGDGQVSSVSANAETLNALRSGILTRLEKLLNGKATAYVPIGSFTGVGVLNGRGPQVPIKLKLEGAADISFQTEFDSAGINQSCHRITMIVKTRAYSQSQRFSAQVEEESATVLAETVVVGKTPEMLVRAK